jgi:hypothetical protein
MCDLILQSSALFLLIPIILVSTPGIVDVLLIIVSFICYTGLLMKAEPCILSRNFSITSLFLYLIPIIFFSPNIAGLIALLALSFGLFFSLSPLALSVFKAIINGCSHRLYLCYFVLSACFASIPIGYPIRAVPPTVWYNLYKLFRMEFFILCILNWLPGAITLCLLSLLIHFGYCSTIAYTLLSPMQPFSGNKPQYFNIPVNLIVMGSKYVSILPKPKDRETAAIYLSQVGSILEDKIKRDLFPLLKDPISTYSKEGLTFDHMNKAIHNKIQKEETELKLWLRDYNKRYFDNEKESHCRKTEGRKVNNPLTHKLFFYILNNAYEKTTPIIPIIT